MLHLRVLLRGDARNIFVYLANYSFTLPLISPSISRDLRLPTTPHIACDSLTLYEYPKVSSLEVPVVVL